MRPALRGGRGGGEPAARRLGVPTPGAAPAEEWREPRPPQGLLPTERALHGCFQAFPWVEWCGPASPSGGRSRRQELPNMRACACAWVCTRVRGHSHAGSCPRQVTRRTREGHRRQQPTPLSSVKAAAPPAGRAPPDPGAASGAGASTPEPEGHRETIACSQPLWSPGPAAEPAASSTQAIVIYGYR